MNSDFDASFWKAPIRAEGCRTVKLTSDWGLSGGLLEPFLHALHTVHLKLCRLSWVRFPTIHCMLKMVEGLNQNHKKTNGADKFISLLYKDIMMLFCFHYKWDICEGSLLRALGWHRNWADKGMKITFRRQDVWQNILQFLSLNNNKSQKDVKWRVSCLNR